MAGEERPPDAEDPGSETDLAALAGRDQTSSDSDQTGSDLDQTFSDVDQTASDRDQRASDRDQAAADSDQRESDAGHSGADARPAGETSRRTRSQSTLDRDISSHARQEAARARDAVAERRDIDADARDADAERRDAIMATIDAEMAQLERRDADARANGALSAHEQAVADRRRAAAARQRSADVRTAAARDRAAARGDRARAAEDRRAAQASLLVEALDHLTGALRRNAGLEGLRRELERTRQDEELLTVAFIDVNNLKHVNDEHGHAAGDELLRAVVSGVRALLRPDDLILRFGGDEFVGVLAGHAPAHLVERFDELATNLAGNYPGSGLTVGFAEATPEDNAEQLIARADQAMIALRREHRSGR